MRMELTRDNLMQFINAEITKKSTEIETQLGKRKKNAYSWNTLERQAGVPKDTIRDFMRAKTTVLRADKLQKVLSALQYDVVICKRTINSTP